MGVDPALSEFRMIMLITPEIGRFHRPLRAAARGVRCASSCLVKLLVGGRVAGRAGPRPGRGSTQGVEGRPEKGRAEQCGEKTDRAPKHNPPKWISRDWQQRNGSE